MIWESIVGKKPESRGLKGAPEVNEITEKIIGAAMRVHRILGPGLMESVYEEALAADLNRCGLKVLRQQSVPIVEGVKLKKRVRADLVVEGKVVVEIKSVRTFASFHFSQLLSYLRLMKYPAGLLLNFGKPRLKDGIRRILNDR
jgi:GxxExxY protein